MKKKTFLVLAASLLLAGCGGGGGTPAAPSETAQTSEQRVVKYTVKFANTSMADVEIEAGKYLQKPVDPSQANSVFVGWYKEAAFQTAVNFPLLITSDTTIYASFYSYQEAFSKARNNTIGDSVAGYEYDYILNVTVGYMSANLTGNTVGNSKYVAGASDVSFYDEHVNSGALFYDGSKYQIKKGRELHEVSLDENDNVKKYDIKEVGEEYKYDSSSFAKAIFEYSDDKLKSIKPTAKANEYELDVAFNPSQAIALVGNYVNHPVVEKLIGKLPDTSVDTAMYVTFSGDKLNTYRYVMSIDVTGIKLDLTYDLTFKNQGEAPTIVPKVFNNTYVSEADVTKAKNEINGHVNTYRALEHSSYDFLVKTAVDYPNKNAINATIDGFTKRKVNGDDVYFLNDYEVDTDHKNADLYKSKGLGDCHGGRAKLSTGEVHDLKKKALGGYSDVKTVTDYAKASTDDYYLLDVMGMFSTITFVQKLTDEKNGTIIYNLGTTNDGAASVLAAFNDTLRLNPLGECSVEVKAFGSFAASSVEVNDFEFKITLLNGALSEISLEMNGSFSASFPESRDFAATQDAAFTLKYSLEVTDDGASYEPGATVDKVK